MHLKEPGSMPKYSFIETVHHFGEKLKKKAPQEDLESGEVELVVDHFHVLISKGILEGSLMMQLCLGLMLQPIKEQRLKELSTSNYLGVNSGGCMIALDETEALLFLRASTTPGTTPQENWEWLHRILLVAHEWNKVLNLWEDFVPLIPSGEL